MFTKVFPCSFEQVNMFFLSSFYHPLDMYSLKINLWHSGAGPSCVYGLFQTIGYIRKVKI